LSSLMLMIVEIGRLVKPSN